MTAWAMISFDVLCPAEARSRDTAATQPDGQSRGQEALSPRPQPTGSLHSLGVAGRTRTQEGAWATAVVTIRSAWPSPALWALHVDSPLGPPGGAGDPGPGSLTNGSGGACAGNQSSVLEQSLLYPQRTFPFHAAIPSHAALRNWQGRLNPMSDDTGKAQRLCLPLKPLTSHPSHIAKKRRNCL